MSLEPSVALLQETLPYLRALHEQYPNQPSIAGLIGRIEATVAEQEAVARQAAEWGKSFVTFSWDGTAEDYSRQFHAAVTGLAAEYAPRDAING